MAMNSSMIQKKSWKPTAIRDQSMEKSFSHAMLRDQQPSRNLKTESSQEPSGRNSQQRLVDRLYSDAEKKARQKKLYEQEKIRRETAGCTFVPNRHSKTKTIPAKELNISLYRKGDSQIEIRDIERKRRSKSRRAQPIYEHQIIASENEADKSAVVDPKLQESCLTGRSGKKNEEFFDYLAYHGVKSHKSAALEKLKEQEQLAQCTFKPQIIKYNRQFDEGKNVYETLLEQKKDHQVYEEAKKELEMQGCTFKPQINQKSDRMASSTRKADPNSKSYEILHKKQMKQQEKTKKLIQDKEEKELQQCTFQP